MAAGRKPAAILSLAIGISPKNRGEFLIETAPLTPSDRKGRD
jgi:hypothetical protein